MGLLIAILTQCCCEDFKRQWVVNSKVLYRKEFILYYFQFILKMYVKLVLSQLSRLSLWHNVPECLYLTLEPIWGYDLESTYVAHH